MRITPQRTEHAETTASQQATRKAPAAAGSQPAAAAHPRHTPAALASEVLSQASQRLQAMPDVDLTRVAEVRAALARGEVSLDAGKLANIIADYHRS